MDYAPLNDKQKAEWVEALEFIVPRLEGLPERHSSELLGSDQGDISDLKDIVGTFLATLTNKTVTIK